MTREERRAVLGDDVIAYINDCADAAPDPTPELIEELRRILTNPAGRPVSDRR
ncbi:hypothetical protein ACFZAM_02930 [Streptomyces sp. NPDC008079]|uniref:hypothetical protein n=1 Tax=Streptomyces sp. NPDC008079 TaxID=3364806 RepID=UPI0036E12B70